MGDSLSQQSAHKDHRKTAFNTGDGHHPSTEGTFSIFIIASCVVVLLGFIYYRAMKRKSLPDDVLKFFLLFSFLTAIFFIIYLNVYAY